MKGDFSRIPAPERVRRYTGVLKQQGRVDLDADWNEHAAIRERLDRLAALDTIGRVGVPETGGGFAVGVTPDGAELTLAPGRIWVDGLLCELDAAATYRTQPHLPEPEALTEGDAGVDGRTDLVFLDVWQRHVTAVEDPDLLDPALGGLDTTTRLQTVWQVRLLKGVGAASCDLVPGFPPPPSGALLSNDATALPDAADPCAVVAAGGYRGVENRLYRVEIHDAGPLGVATWKWSRDNGAVLFAVEEFFAAPANRLRLQALGRDAVLTLRQDDWVEILDDASELGLRPGFTARVESVDPATRIVTLDRDVPAGAFTVAAAARVRRWDQALDVDADGLLPTGPGPFELEDGVQVRFGGSDLRTGDHWTFAARTAGGTVDRLADAPPSGIRHAFAPLALVRWSQTGPDAFAAAVVGDCRPSFPPLTDIGAEDVSYDNGACDLPGVRTVQDALDALCRARDLRFHNKHLHGWGIVCGLKVVCGPENADGLRDRVTVRTGYAIDCEGNDVLVEDPIRVDLLDRIGERDAANPNAPILDASGDGDVCLVLERTPDGPRVAVEPMGPMPGFWQRVTSGTLLMDFYDRCVRRVVDFLRAELSPPPADGSDAGGELVGPAQRRFTTLINLLIQLANPSNGRYVYLSMREHTLLRDLYQRLRALLRSETFCAMFADARPFPEYPFPEETLSTSFGKGFHSRLRLDPRGSRGYTVGTGNRIHVFDLEREEMVAEVEFPGGVGVTVRDVAVSADGRRLFGVGTLGSDTLFAAAEIEGDAFRFRPATVICDIHMLTLAIPPEGRNVLAVGRGRGLFEINPEAVQERPTPRYAFNACGHLVVPGNGFAYATARAENTSPDQYDRVVRLQLGGNGQTVFPFSSPTTGQQILGSDDIAVVTGSANRQIPDQLWAVADAGGGKQLLLFNAAATGSSGAAASVPLDGGAIQLAVAAPYLVVAYEESYRLALVDTATGQVVTSPSTGSAFRHPVQISPRSVAVARERETLHVLNYASNTLTHVPLRYLRPEAQLDNEALAAYRDAILASLFDLAGGFLQYLKDCFCDHFLVDCPECDGDERIFLACASVRGGQVYRVCNFSRRRYVKSFPTVEYWLSVVPVIPVVRELVASFCCSVLPDVFGRFAPGRAGAAAGTAGMAAGSAAGSQAAPTLASTDRVSAMQVRQGVEAWQRLDFTAMRREMATRLDVVGALTRDWAGTAATERVTRAPAPATGQVVGQRVEQAREELSERGVRVAGVEAYDPRQGAAGLVDFVRTGGRVPTDRPVTLVEEDGVVRYFRVAETETAAASPAAASAGAGAVAAPDTARLEAEVARLSGMMQELTQAREALNATRAEVETLRGELADTRRSAETSLAARDLEIAALRASTRELERGMQGVQTLRADVDRLRIQRPPG